MNARFGCGTAALRTLLLFVALAACGHAAPPTEATLPEIGLSIVTSDGARHAYVVEVARTSDEQAKGMMYRRSMPQGHGMLFPFVPARPAAFWMANTYIPLDLVFVARGGRIESILADVPALTEDRRASLGPVAAVLELDAGEAARIGAKPGDLVEYDLRDLPAAAN